MDHSERPRTRLQFPLPSDPAWNAAAERHKRFIERHPNLEHDFERQFRILYELRQRHK